MNWRLWTLAALAVCALSVAEVQAGGKQPAKKVTWKKIVVDTAFRAEGVAVADVNKDGKKDILAGDVWFEAPDWKVHKIRPGKDNYRDGDKNVYSTTFCVWAEDINKDGWIDQIVVPFPGAEMFWYENPANKGGMWKAHPVWHSACNETPQYLDLFGTGKRVLIMGWQPKGKDNQGQMAWFTPGDDVTKPWVMHPISEPSKDKQVVPGTNRFSHGLGVGDVNGDKKRDVMCTGGWWQQPDKVTDQPWQFHKVDLGPNCADMYAFDIDGDGKNDIISSSAHECGFWWHKQGLDGTFVRRDLFPTPATLAAIPKSSMMTPDQAELFKAVNSHRVKKQLVSSLPFSSALSKAAQAYVLSGKKVPLPQFLAKEKIKINPGAKAGASLFVLSGNNLDEQIKSLADQQKGTPAYATEMGVAHITSADGQKGAIVLFADTGKFLLPGQTHAMHFVDIDGDGQKDLVTGQRFWAHGPRGDYAPNDPAFLYWFKAQKSKDGVVTFVPHEIDDDSGVGTQFTVEDIDGDGIPDVIVSNKKGTFILIQVRQAGVQQPANKED